VECHPEKYYNGKHKQQGHDAGFGLLGCKFLYMYVFGLGLLCVDIGMLEPWTAKEIYQE